MTTRTRSAAENEAGARAIYQNRSQTRWAWEELEQKQRDHFIAVAKDALAAADAAAAPAVGVTVDADMLLKWRQVVNFSIQHITDDEWQSRLNRVMQEMSEVTRELRHRTVHPPFLLTAQPDPGTHDDTRQARIAAGVRAFWEAGPGSAQTDIDEYEFADVLRARFAAGIDAADAVARSVCPPDCVVVRRDDLETALYGSQYWGEELRQDGEQEALDRLRALIGDE